MLLFREIFVIEISIQIEKFSSPNYVQTLLPFELYWLSFECFWKESSMGTNLFGLSIKKLHCKGQ
jgi:hypothetical protein